MGGGNYLKYLKRGGTEKRGQDTKILKKGGASWVKGWVTSIQVTPFFMVYMLVLSQHHQHQPTMINTGADEQ